MMARMFHCYVLYVLSCVAAGGLRTAGAVASQPTRLLSLHKHIYRMVTNQYREMLYSGTS
jgi:hypothetical protein